MILKKINAKASKSMVRETNCSFGKRFLSGALVATLLFPNITVSRVFGKNQPALSSTQEKSESFYSRTTAKFKELYSKSKNAVESGADWVVNKGGEAVGWAKNNPVTAGVGVVASAVIVTGVIVLPKALSKKSSVEQDTPKYSLNDPEYSGILTAFNEDNFALLISHLSDLSNQKVVLSELYDQEGLPFIYSIIKNQKKNLCQWAFHQADHHFCFDTDTKHMHIEKYKYGNDRETILHMAAKRGDIDVIKFLREYGMDFNVLDANGRTAFHTAVMSNNATACYELILGGINTDKHDTYGKAAIEYSFKYENADFLRIALSLYANDKRPEEPNGRAISLTTSCVPQDDKHSIDNVIKYIEDNSLSIATPDANGETILLKSIRKGNIYLFCELLNRKADIKHKLNNGTSALQVAIQYACMQDNAKDARIIILDELIKNDKVDINSKDKGGNTALHTAATYWTQGTITKLVNKGAKLEEKNNQGYTPLHVAAGGQNLKAVEELINLGANINAKTNSGETPLDLATNDAIRSYLNKIQPKSAEQPVKPKPPEGDTGVPPVFDPTSSRRLPQQNSGSSTTTERQNTGASEGQNKTPRPLLRTNLQDRPLPPIPWDESTVTNPGTPPQNPVDELKKRDATGKGVMNSLTHVANGGDNARRKASTPMEIKSTDTPTEQALKRLFQFIPVSAPDTKKQMDDGYSSDTTSSSITHGDDDEDWDTNPDYENPDTRVPQ